MKLLNKLGLGLVALFGANSVANAAVTFDAATKTFAGEFDLTPYYGAITIAVSAIAIIVSIALGVRQLKKVG